MKPLKVAMIEPVGGHGGMDYYDFGLCGGLARAGVRVRLYTCNETLPSDDATFTLRTWYRGIYGKGHILVRGVRFVLATARVFGDVVRTGARIVHFHFFDVGALQLWQVGLAKILFRKVVVTVHDVEGFVQGKGSRSLARLAYRWADGLIVHNAFSKEELASALGVVRRMSVIPHGNYCHMYPDMPRQDEARARLGWPPSEKILLFFGQIKGVKRLDLLLEAFSRVLKKQPDTRLVIAGKVVDVPFREYSERMDALEISGKCTCLVRYIRNEEVPLLYAASDLVVLPYARIYQSGVLIMAMSLARAVVVSDLPPMLEIVNDGTSGYVFKSGDAGDLAACLLRALEDDAKREAIAQEGFRLMEDRYGWTEIGARHAAFYADLVNAKEGL